MTGKAGRQATPQMRSVVYGCVGPEVRLLPKPALIQPDDVLLQVAAVGICGSDLRMLEAPGDRIGTVFGHEIAAVVCEAGPLAALRVGQHVVVNPNLWCQSCWFCRSGTPNLCNNLKGIGSKLNGGAADYCVVPARLLHPVPAGLDLDVAALAEPLSCVIHGLRRTGGPIVGSALILGGGPIGLLALLVLRISGVRPISVVEPYAKRAAAAQSLGADVVFHRIEDARDWIARGSEGRGVDLVVDAAAGNIPDAVTSVRKGGVVVAISYGKHASALSSEAVVTREISVVGSFTGAGALPAALDLLAEHPGEFRKVISHRMPLTEAHTALDLLRSRAATKILLHPLAEL